MLMDEELDFKAAVKELDEFLKGAGFGKKHRDKAADYALALVSDDPDMILLFRWLRKNIK